MARLNAKWENFLNRGQVWDHFWQDDTIIFAKQVAQAQCYIEGAITYTAVGNAGSTILQTYISSAQAQSSILLVQIVQASAQTNIRATYTVSANAQAHIQAVYTSYAQSEAWIVAEYQAYSQAQAQILTTYHAAAQALSQIRTTNYAVGNSIAQILSTYTQSGQAQAQIKQEYVVLANAQADIRQTYLAHAQAQGWFRRSEQVYAQAEVHTLATYTAISQAQVHIFTTYLVYSQAEAYIGGQAIEYQVFGQAEVLVQIPGLTKYFYDSFNRPDSEILGAPFSVGTADTGTPWVWNSWDDNVAESLTPLYIHNSVLVHGLLNGAQTFSSMHNTGASIDDGELLIDIWVAAAGDNGAMTYWFDKYWHIKTKNSETTDDTTFYFMGLNSPSWIAVPDAITTRSAWYRLRVVVNSSSSEYVKAHIWKIGDIEPVTWTVVQDAPLPSDYADWAYYGALPAMLDIYETPYNEPAKFDNITVTGFSYTIYNQGLGQAEAHILVKGVQNYSQAQAILNQGWGLGQAEVHIFVTDVQNYAQAQTHILIPDIQVYSQAQAVLNQGWGIGQSLSTIIIRDNNQYAQAGVLCALQRVTTVYEDTFSRTTTAPPFNLGSPDIGPPWIWTSDDSSYRPDGSTSPTHVENGVLTGPIGSSLYDSMQGPPSITEGEFYMDFWLPASGDNSLRFYYYDDTWYFQVYPYETYIYVAGNDTSYNVTPITRSSWYRVHATIDTSAAEKVKISVWKIGNSEPAQTTIQTTDDSANGRYFDIYYSPTNETAKFDNFRIEAVSNFLYNQGYAHTQASILTTYLQHGLAEVIINQHLQTGQAAVSIYTTYQTYSQSQANILKLAGYANAATRIAIPSSDSYGYMVSQDGAASYWPMDVKASSGIDIIDGEILAPYYQYYYDNYNSEQPGINPSSRKSISFSYYYAYLRNNSTPLRFRGPQWSVEAWARFDTLNSRFPVFGASGTANNLSIGLGGATQGSNGSYISAYHYFSSSTHAYTNNVTISSNTWYYLALTNNNGLYTLYVDGVQAAQWSAPSLVANNLYIGYDPYTGYPAGGNAWIDGVAAYDKVLTQDQITNHFIAGNTQAYAQAQVVINRHWSLAQSRFWLYNPAPGATNIWQTFSQAETHILTTIQAYSQANVRITDAKDQNVYGQAQTVIIPMQGLLKYFVQAATWHYLLPDSGTYAQITSMTADTDPAQINLGGLGSNYGVKWQSWFVADMTGPWWFQTRSDDNSAIFIYDEQNQVVGSMLNNWGSTGGQGATTRNGYINLVAGTKYKIDVKWNQGGGGAEMSAWYSRPGGTVGLYLLSNEAPWNDKSKLPEVRYWGMGLANALWVERNGDFYVWPNYAQAQARVYYPAQKGYAQAQTQVGAFWYAQAIAQIAYTPTTTDYRATVLADKPTLYYPMDEQPNNAGLNLVRLAGSTYTGSSQYNASYAYNLAADGNYSDGWASSGYSASDGIRLDIGTWWKIEWFSVQTLNYVRLTSRPGNDYMGYGRIVFSDGTTYNVTFPTTPNQTRVYRVPASNIIWMQIISDGGGVSNPGFSEVEAFVDNPDNFTLHTIVGRRDATFNYGYGPTRNEPSAIITGSSIDFNGYRASDEGQLMRDVGTTSTAPFSIPGYSRTSNSANIISPAWWGRAGDRVTVYIGTAPASADIGIWSETTGENQWWSRGGPQTTSGLDSNTQYTFTLTTTGVHWVYLWTYNAGYTGTGYVTIPGSFIAQDPAYDFKTVGSVVTVEAWIKWSGTTDYQMIFAFDRYNFSVYNGNLIVETPDGQNYGTSNTPIAAGLWYHVAAVMYNQQAFSTNTRIYINGAQQSLSGAGTATGLFQEWFSIGGWTENGNYSFQGHIDELALYNYALTSEQILAHYRSVKRQIYGWSNAWIRGRYSVHANAQVFGGRQEDGWYHDFKYFGAALAIVMIYDNSVFAQANALIQTDYGLVRMTWDNAQWVIGDIFNWSDTEWEQGQINYSDGGKHPSSYPGNNNWGMAWSGNFIADADGQWQFRTTSDDGSDLWISETRVVDNRFGYGHGSTTVTGSITLVAGNFYTIHTRFGQGTVNWRMVVEYRRPGDSVWYYLNDHNPPWIRKYWYGGFAQATAQILPVPNIKVHGLAEAKLNSFGWIERGLAQADILQTYRVYGLAHAVLNRGWGIAQARVLLSHRYQRTGQAYAILNQYWQFGLARARFWAFGVKGYAQAKVHIKAHDIRKYAQAKAAITYTQHWHGLAAVSVKQTYPLTYINPNYSLASLGTTVLPDPNFSMEETVPESVIDGSIVSVWTNFLAIDVNANQYFYLNLDLGTQRTISSYYILPFKYNVTANLQYNTRGYIDLSDPLTKDDAAWTDIVTNIYFDVHITDPISYADAIFEEISPTTARYWRLKFTSGGDDNKVSIATFQLGVSTTVGAFAQAMASFGHFGVAQAMSYTSPGLSTWHGQTRTHIKTTSTRYAQAQTWYLPPTYHGLAQTLILRTYIVHGTAMVWALSPTWFGLSEVWITTISSSHGLALANIKTTYRKYGLARAFIDKFVEVAQAQALIYHRSMASGNARVFIGHFASGLAQAYIIKSKAHGQALADIKQDYTKYAQAAVFIHRLEVFSQGMALIYRTYSKHGQAMAVLNRYWQFGLALTTSVGTYARVAQAKVKIRAIVNPAAYANSYIKTRNLNYAQAEAYIWKRSTVSAQAMTQVGAFWYANAQARIIAFDVPKTGLAAGYILVDINVLPTTPASNLQSYLVMYNNHTLPGYAQSEFMSSVARLFTAKGAYIDSSIVDYLGLENKEITLKMLVWEPTYLECKIRVQEAATLLRSKRKAYNKLYLQYFNKYYEAMPKSISTDKVVGTSVQRLEYGITFEARPWLISNDVYALTGTGTVETTGRTLLDGGWTPTVIIVSGTDITISGVTEYGESTGSIEIAGTVSNYVIDSDNFETSDNALITPKDYGIYVGPGKTTFTITGATDCRIEYHNRWYM